MRYQWYPGDTAPIDKKITSADIVAALDEQFNDGDQWIGFAEFRPGTGFSNCSDRYIDYWAINCFKGGSKGPYHKLSFEVKISRSDFMSEIKKADKRKMGLLISNQFYFAAPKDLIKPADLPPECGLIEFHWVSNQAYIDDCNAPDRAPYGTKAPEYQEKLMHSYKVHAPEREHLMPGWKFVAALARRVNRANKEQVAKANEADYYRKAFFELQERLAAVQIMEE